MPGVLPRAKSLFGSGFGFLAYLMATIFNATRLLPNEHPYLRPANIGQYSVRSVFAQAGERLVFDRKHIDQLAIYFTLMLGFILLVLQFVFLVIGVIAKPVLAAPGFTGMFNTPSPNRDIAFVLLDKVFGVPGFFNSDYAPTGAPLPFHQALQSLFQFYSTALLLVAVIIFLYYVLVIIAETAQTGTPFGRRFNHLWAPIRLVVALGLLVPINYGLNSGQYIVLMAAKMGSGFATNGWLLFNSSMGNALGADDNTLFARPKVPDSWPLVKFMTLAATCKVAYDRLGVTGINAYIVKNPANSQVVTAADYDTALAFYDNRDIVIRFGQKDTDKHGSQPGAVFPYCGEITLKTTVATNTGTNIGPYTVQARYFIETMLLWDDFSLEFGDIMAHRTMPNKELACPNPPLWNATYFDAAGCTNEGGITNDEIAMMRREEQALGYERTVRDARQAMVDNASLAIPQDMLDRGWGGAGIWYNRVADMNGTFFTAVSHLPSVSLLPLPMKLIMEANTAANQNVSIQEMFTPNLSDGQATPISGNEALVGQVLYESYQKLGADDTFMSSETSKKQNIFRDTLNLLMGLNGLFTLRENTDIHPLAQLVGLGKGIVDSALRNLFVATVFSAGGGAFNAFPDAKGLAAFANMGSSIFTTLATIGLSVGFMLYYVLPFLPFMYFFFAVGTWLKTIFEAMVGAPLWALAHLRIDGHGLPGESAMGGYFMILEIFLRPILTVFGLIGALIIFAAMVRVLNEIFTLVTANLAGFDNNPCNITTPGGECTLAGATAAPYNSNTQADSANPIVTELLKFKRDTVDEFFFTIIYTIIVYMMANSSFKMIDQVPSKILRWMGAGVQVFSDGTNTDDAVRDMKRYAAFSGANMTAQFAGGLTQSASKTAQGIMELRNGGAPTGTRTTGGGGGGGTP